MLRRQMRSHLRLKQLNQRGIHEPVLVRDTETKYPLVSKPLPEPRREFRLLRFFHDEDQIRPLDQFWSDGCFGIMAQPGGRAFDRGMLREKFLGGWASPAVLAANE